jgi:hypothetical protein
MVSKAKSQTATSRLNNLSTQRFFLSQTPQIPHYIVRTRIFEILRCADVRERQILC